MMRPAPAALTKQTMGRVRRRAVRRQADGIGIAM
jgi:hypothetical protein